MRTNQAESDADLRVAQELFAEYADSLAIDLSFQDFDREPSARCGMTQPAGATLGGRQVAILPKLVTLQPTGVPIWRTGEGGRPA